MRTRILLTLLLSVIACNDAEKPVLCVFDAPNAAGELTVNDACKKPIEVRAGQTLVVLHELPEGVVIDDEVTFTVETACERTSTTRPYVESPALKRKRAVLTLTAPQGSDCLLSIEAALLNTSARWVSTPIPDRCDAEHACDTGAGGATGHEDLMASGQNVSDDDVASAGTGG